MTNSGDEGQQVERAVAKAAGLVQLYGLYRLFAAMTLPIVGAAIWIVGVIIMGHDALVLLVGVPLFVLALRGWRGAMRANREARARGEIPGHEGVGLIALSLIFTFAGIAVPDLCLEHVLSRRQPVSPIHRRRSSARRKRAATTPAEVIS